MTIMGVQAAREAARRSQGANNLRQLGVSRPRFFRWIGWRNNKARFFGGAHADSGAAEHQGRVDGRLAGADALCARGVHRRVAGVRSAGGVGATARGDGCGGGRGAVRRDRGGGRGWDGQQCGGGVGGHGQAAGHFADGHAEPLRQATGDSDRSAVGRSPDRLGADATGRSGRGQRADLHQQLIDRDLPAGGARPRSAAATRGGAANGWRWWWRPSRRSGVFPV